MDFGILTLVGTLLLLSLSTPERIKYIPELNRSKEKMNSGS